MNDTTIAFIGLGLIGGSLAKGIKRARPDIRIMAYMRTRSKLEQAKKDGIVDVILDGIDEQLKECDLIFLCTPVEYNAQYLSKIRSYLKPGALITDVGSTKTDIHEEILRQGLTDYFVGGHPMAGSEKTGYENATDHLLENAYYIVTPPEGLDQSGSETGNIPPKYAENANRIIAVAQTVGAIPLVLDYREHDKVVAAISHLPHLVASSLVNLVKDADSPAGTMKRVAAGGFKDITRIASSSPVIVAGSVITDSLSMGDKGRNNKSPSNMQFDGLLSLISSLLDYQDSNLDKQNQNLLCYHYTIVQSLCAFLGKRCKDTFFYLYNPNIFALFFATICKCLSL